MAAGRRLSSSPFSSHAHVRFSGPPTSPYLAGIDFTAYNAGGGPPVYTALSVAAAADVLDALIGQEPAAAPGALGSWWRDLWDAVKSGAAEVVHFAVSVGRDIYLGLKYIVQSASSSTSTRCWPPPA